MTGGAPARDASEPSATARWVIELLRPCTPFAEAIVRRQAERAGLTIAALGPEHMAKVGPMILGAAKMFADPAKIEELRRRMDRG